MPKVTNWSDGDVLTASELNDVARCVFQADDFPAVGSISISGLDLETDKRYTMVVKGGINSMIRFNTSTTGSAVRVIEQNGGATITDCPGSMVWSATTDAHNGAFVMGEIMQDATFPVYYTNGVFGRGGNTAVQFSRTAGKDYGTTANVTTIHLIVGSPPPNGSIWLYKNKGVIS